jgi:hypothetical protein
VLKVRDVPYAITEDAADYATMGPLAPVIWNDVGLTKEGFFGVAKAHGLWPTKGQQKIHPFLNAWELENVGADGPRGILSGRRSGR